MIAPQDAGVRKRFWRIVKLLGIPWCVYSATIKSFYSREIGMKSASFFCRHFPENNLKMPYARIFSEDRDITFKVYSCALRLDHHLFLFLYLHIAIYGSRKIQKVFIAFQIFTIKHENKTLHFGKRYLILIWMKTLFQLLHHCKVPWFLQICKIFIC